MRLCALQGVSKGFMPKGELSDNQWAFVGGSRVEVLPEPRCAARARHAHTHTHVHASTWRSAAGTGHTRVLCICSGRAHRRAHDVTCCGWQCIARQLSNAVNKQQLNKQLRCPCHRAVHPPSLPVTAHSNRMQQSRAAIA